MTGPFHRHWPRQLRIRPGVFVAIALLLALFRWWTVAMPGSSYSGTRPLAVGPALPRGELEQHVRVLASEIGARSIGNPEGLRAAAAYIEEVLTRQGYATSRQGFTVGDTRVFNIEAQVTGSLSPEEIVVIGAHYDSLFDQPGANDNASGVAALLAIAGRLRSSEPRRTLRFVAFVNEEPPWFQSESMGSYVYARRCRDRSEAIHTMWSLDTLGYYTQEKGSQSYPMGLLRLFYPSRGNFVAFASNSASRSSLHEAIGAFREHGSFPSEGAVLPAAVPGIGWSDHWSFWQFGYPGILITDTALFRDPHYHTETDSPEHLDYESLARVADGLARALKVLCER